MSKKIKNKKYMEHVFQPLCLWERSSRVTLFAQHRPQAATKRTASVFNRLHIILTKSSSPSTRPEDGSIAPSIVVLLNTPLILLPMRLIPKVSPLFDVFLWAESEMMRGICDGAEWVYDMTNRNHEGMPRGG